MSEVISKAGIHCVGPRRNGYGPFCQTISDAGRRLSLVKVRDDFGAVDQPLALWPDVLCIGVKTDWDGGPFNAQAAANNIIAAHAQKPVIHYWEYLNEINGLYSEQADFYIELMPLLKAAGIGLVMFSCASGTPPKPGETVSLLSRVKAAALEARLAIITKSMTARIKRQLSAVAETPYEAIARACKYAKDNGFDVMLAVHEYNSDGGTIGRFKVLADYLEAHNASIPIVITEYGFETHPGDDEFMAMIRANEPIYADPRVVGLAPWTLGGGGWQGSNYENALPQLGEYIATVQPLDPPPSDEWEFDYWDLDGTPIYTNPIHIIMDEAHTLTPHAKKKTPPPPVRFPLTLNPCPEWAGLVVNVNPAGMLYDVGTDVACEAMA